MISPIICFDFKKAKWSIGPFYLYEFVFWTLLLNLLSIESLDSTKLNILNPSYHLLSLCGIKMAELDMSRVVTRVGASETTYLY